ncbi:hypothetical protein E2C01_032273 [Portunus trituberculatus]|uniref:Uncharacterized protein n=1 Tax=Portunus trituberculatus TaxID=210409 RepID=A0A5B7F0G6_PORTR|nr:hypothetical protein [Portunus trituberculatus]
MNCDNTDNTQSCPWLFAHQGLRGQQTTSSGRNGAVKYVLACISTWLSLAKRHIGPECLREKKTEVRDARGRNVSRPASPCIATGCLTS